MNSLFFWIIVLSFLVPMAMRLYRKSVRGRNQDQSRPGGFSGQFGQFPGGQSKQPRDGYTQQDYYGGFGQLGAPRPPANQPYPGQQFPGQQGYQAPVPYEDSPEYLNNPPQPRPEQQGSGRQDSAQQQPSGPSVPPPPSAPQGFRARKLAELDQRYSNGELAMEDYMAQRAEIMKG
ncbi:hypothetical protein ACVWZ8_000238 [Arthrobacter sp. UYCu723]